MTKKLRFVKRLGAIYRVLLETPAGCWLIDCNGPSPPFFATNLDSYERVSAPDGWMDANQTTPAQEARLQMIQPLLDCNDCIPDKSLRYKMAADAAQQYDVGYSPPRRHGDNHRAIPPVSLSAAVLPDRRCYQAQTYPTTNPWEYHH